MNLPPGARILPLKPSSNQYKETVHDAPASLQQLRQETLLPRSLENASYRVKKLKQLYTIPAHELLRLHHESVNTVTRQLRLCKFVRNVKIDNSSTSGNTMMMTNKSIAGMMCMPFTCCCSCSSEVYDLQHSTQQTNKDDILNNINNKVSNNNDEQGCAILTGSVDGLITLWNTHNAQPMAHNIESLSSSGAYSGRVETLVAHPRLPICFSANRLDTYVTAWTWSSSLLLSETENKEGKNKILPTKLSENAKQNSLYRTTNGHNAQSMEIRRLCSMTRTKQENSNSTSKSDDSNNEEYDTSAWIKCLAADCTGTLLAAGRHNGILTLFDIETGKEMSKSQLSTKHREHNMFHYLYDQDGMNGQSINSCQFHPDGTSLCSVCDDGGRVITYDVRCGQVAFHTILRNSNSSNATSSLTSKATFTKNKDYNKSLSRQGTINDFVYDYGGHLKRARCLCWSPCGTLICSGGADNVIQIWDVRMLYKQQNVSININNNTMSTSAASNQIAPFQLIGHDDEITSISCYPNPIGNKVFENNSNLSTLPFLLVSTSLDHTIRLWDMNTGNCVKTLNTAAPVWQHCLPLTSQTTTPSWIVSIGHEKYWSLWDLADQDTPYSTTTPSFTNSTNSGNEQSLMPTDTTEVILKRQPAINYTSNNEEDEDDEDEEDEMSALRRIAPQSKVNKVNDISDHDDEEDDEDDDKEEDEMEMLKRHRV